MNHGGGTERKRRAGKRKNKTKSDRIRLKCLNVGYWNCSNAGQRAPVLENALYDSNIVLLQDTFTELLQFPGFQC